MSNHSETTPSGNQPPDPRSGGGNNTPVDNTPVRNTPQDRAIIITDEEPLSLRRPIANSPPVFISNDDLLKELHYLRSQVREQQALKERVVQLESLVPRTHRSGKQPFEEENQSGHRDERRHVIVPRNLFASGGRTTVGGEDRRLENARDGGRPPRQDDRRATAHLKEASRDINSLAERYRGRFSRVDLLALIKDFENRPENASIGSRTASAGRDGHRRELPHGPDSRSYDKSTEREPRGLGCRTERDPIVLEGRQSHGGTREYATSLGKGMTHQQVPLSYFLVNHSNNNIVLHTISCRGNNVCRTHLDQTTADPHIPSSSQANASPSAQIHVPLSNLADKRYLYTLIGLHFHLNWLVVLKCLVSFDVFLVFFCAGHELR